MERYKEKIPLDTCVVKSIVKSIENADYLYQNYICLFDYLFMSS